jgi:transcriptional antiterminator NusG
VVEGLTVDDVKSPPLSRRSQESAQDHVLVCPSAASSRVEEGLRSAGSQWVALWARTQCEQSVHDQLLSKGFCPFLPKLDVWLRRHVTRYRASVPMFPGYLFLNHRMDKRSYIEVANTRGLIQVLGGRWDSLASIPDREIEAVERLHRTRAHARPHPYLREGQCVRITQGVLAGLEGILLRTGGDRGRLVVSVMLLQRSVAVEIDCTLVEPTDDGRFISSAQLPHPSLPVAPQPQTATTAAGS